MQNPVPSPAVARNERRILPLAHCVLRGSLGFCGASIAVFATVAFAEKWMYDHLGLGFSYFIWTLLYIFSGWAVFNPLVAGSLRGLRFFGLFGLAFLLYAAGWIGAYFILRGAPGEWCGSLAGSLFMSLVMAGGFKRLHAAPSLFIVLFVTNSLGYFAGSQLNSALGGQVGMLLWGVAYGFCLGAGIGAVMHRAQTLKD